MYLIFEAAILQRVASASVSVDSQLVSSIGKGVLVFAAVAEKDTRKDVDAMAAKVLKMKMWPDEKGTTVSDCSNILVSPYRTAELAFSGNKMFRTSEEKSFVVGLCFCRSRCEQMLNLN